MKSDVKIIEIENENGDIIFLELKRARRMMLFLFLIALVFTPIAYLLNTVRMFVKDMWRLLDLHRVWFSP